MTGKKQRKGDDVYVDRPTIQMALVFQFHVYVRAFPWIDDGVLAHYSFHTTVLQTGGENEKLFFLVFY